MAFFLSCTLVYKPLQVTNAGGTAKVLLTLAFKKMMYDKSRKMGNPVSLAPALCTKAKTVKQIQKGLFS